ncbi:MAG: hypothetical protein VKJ46_03775 [Leptolyngbyaceae bacterium]|nr:hypothetical protein [Leptolyngbyaceae bacterium]
MNLLQQGRKFLTLLILILTLTTTVACGGAPPTNQAAYPPADARTGYSQPGGTAVAPGQQFSTWVVQTSRGLIQDAYVRDNNKLGVVISPQVKPNEVRPLAKSLVQGFHKSYPNRNLSVLVYAPDRKLIMTAKYDDQSRQVEYQ